MFRRTITALLSVFMFFALSVITLAAADVYDLTYDISCGGANEITVGQGSVITVDFYMKRTDKQASFALLSYQNEIEYDKGFFELIIPDEWNFRYTPLPGSKVADERLVGQQPIVKIAQGQVEGLSCEEWIGSFQLKVIGENGTSSTVRSSKALASNLDDVASNLTFINLKVNVGENYNVSYSEEIFDSTVTEKKAFNGVDYQGKILDTVYSELYDWTVTYKIGGDVKNAVLSGNTFTIPGDNITGDIKLDYSKQLNVRIYVEPYAPGITLVRVEGAKDGYTFNGNKMIISANSENMCAWVVEGDLTLQDAEGLIDVSSDASDSLFESTDVSRDGKTNLNDLAIVLGCSRGYYESVTADQVTGYLLSDIDGDREVTQNDYLEIVNAYVQTKQVE